MDDAAVAEIVLGLSKDQHRILCAMSGRHFKTANAIRRHAKVSKVPPFRGGLGQILVESAAGPKFRLTPLGVAVRQAVGALPLNNTMEVHDDRHSRHS